MMRISVWSGDLSDSYLRLIAQLGTDCIDFNRSTDFPTAKEQGYPDLEEVLRIKKKLRSLGLEINRVTLPDITEKFMKNQLEGEVELENTCKALRVFGEAEVPLARQRFVGDVFDYLVTRYSSEHRGGYRSRGEILRPVDRSIPFSLEEIEDWWLHFRKVYENLVPIAEDYNVKLAIHPSDTPLPGTPLGGVGFHRVIDMFPSRNVGFIYCCGTRAEAGGLALVLDEINNYGRKGRIFQMHFRNVRGSLATSGGFEEVLLDDGDMNMFKILLELKRVGFDGCLNPDHIPFVEGDGPSIHQGLAYSIGYIKAQLAALAAIP